MEELFVHALLFSIDCEEYEEYSNTLDTLFLMHPQDEFLLDLETRDYKDAMLHIFCCMNENSFDIDRFGRILMQKIKKMYAIYEIEKFVKTMYELWQRLPQNVSLQDPFHILSYADDCLSWGDEDQCRSLYEEAIHYYDE